jgi:hypothetical protein
MPSSGGILPSGLSLGGEFTHPRLQRGHASLKVGRPGHIGSLPAVGVADRPPVDSS